jgi:hypothetical protein
MLNRKSSFRLDDKAMQALGAKYSWEAQAIKLRRIYELLSPATVSPLTPVARTGGERKPAQAINR